MLNSTIFSSITLGFIGFLITLFYSRHSKKLAEEQLLKQLFTEFNKRYDYLNDYLVEIENRYRTKELFEKAENKDLLKKKVIDYFILCSEEFFWYHHKNRIDNTIWDSWEQGMNYWFNEVEVIKDIWIEEIAKNGKKSYYILDDGVEFFKNKRT